MSGSSPRSRVHADASSACRSAAPLPAEARGGRLAGIVLEPATRLQERGADAGQALQRVGLGRAPGPAGRARRLDRRRRGPARRRDRPTTRSRTRSTTRIRPRQPADDKPVPVLATPRLAAAADDARACCRSRSRASGSPFASSAPSRRFPGVDGQAVVGDAEALAAAVNLARPGAARVNEVWLRLRDPSARRRRRPRARREAVQRARDRVAARARSRRAPRPDRARDAARARRGRRGRARRSRWPGSC